MAMLWAATTWSIWIDRNCRIFQQKVELYKRHSRESNFNFYAIICLFYTNKQIRLNYIM